MEKRNVGKFLSDLVNLVDFNRRHRIEKKKTLPTQSYKEQLSSCNLFSEKKFLHTC